MVVSPVAISFLKSVRLKKFPAFQFIPGFQYQTAGAVFAEFLGFVVFEDAEGFGGVVAVIRRPFRQSLPE